MAEEAVDILLVEDNPSDVELTLHVIRKHKFGDRIEVVRDGADALDFVHGTGAYAGRNRKLVPRVILLDLKLPKIDGLEVLRSLKANDDTRSIPVVVVTSSREDRDLKESYQLGVNSYVVKPVDFEQFTEIVRLLCIYWVQVNERSRPPHLN